MKRRTFLSLLSVLITVWQSGQVNGSDLIDFGSIPTDVLTLDRYLNLIQSAGGIVIIDGIDNDKLLEKPVVRKAGNSLTAYTSFYQISFHKQACVVEPKMESLRSAFLSRTISSFAIKDVDLGDALKALSIKAQTGLFLAALHPSHKKIEINVKDATVEQILLTMASLSGYNRIILSGLVDEQTHLRQDLTAVQFE
jgi:hypothetical protein